LYEPKPPSAIDQGVIVEGVFFYATSEFLPGFILTPACDLEQGKAELVLSCAGRDPLELVKDFLTGDWARLGLSTPEGEIVSTLSGKKSRRLRHNIDELMTQRYPRYHWLDPLPGTQRALVLDFQMLSTLATDELKNSKLLAQLRSPFREQVPARYAAYVGRVGVPDTSEEDLKRSIDALITQIFPTVETDDED
jgi:hypothetical protein